MDLQKVSHKEFISEKEIDISTLSSQLQNQLTKWDADANKLAEIENEGLKALTETSLTERSEELKEKIEKHITKAEREEKETEEKQKAEEKSDEEQKKGEENREETPENKASEKDETTKPELSARKKELEGILRKIYESGKREIKEEELEKMGISGWSDLGWGEEIIGEFKLKEKGMFSEIWIIEKITPTTQTA